MEPPVCRPAGLCIILVLALCGHLLANADLKPLCTAYTFDRLTWDSDPTANPPLPPSQQPGYVAYSQADFAAGLVFQDPRPYVWMTELDDRMAGMTMHGHPSRMRAAFQRLKDGGKLDIVFLGGSVMWGAAFALEGMTIPRWTELVLRKTLPAELGKRMTVVNNAIAGTGSAHFETCLSKTCPEDVDIVILEFAINDAGGWNEKRPFATNEARHAFERLIRKILQLKNRPAVLLLNHATNKDLGPLSNLQPTSYNQKSAELLMTHPNIWPWHGAESEFYELAAHYRIASLSMKAAVGHKMMAGVPGYLLNETRTDHLNVSSGKYVPNKFYLEPNAGRAFYYDQVHADGNTGMRVHGELVAQFLLDSAASVYAVPVTSKELAKINAPIPIPAFLDNYERETSSCTEGQDLEKIASPGAGWKLTDEGRNKWGYVSETVGSILRINVNTTLDPPLDAMKDPRKASVALEYLRSYAHMGMAKITCEADCTCEPSTLDGYNPQRVSLLREHHLIVTQGANCTIVITVLKETKCPEKENKVKIMGIDFAGLK